MKKNLKKIESKEITIMNDTLNLAIQGIESVKNVINQELVQLVNFIFKLKGRLIVSGMGKSGIIAQKIAATLASTGTKAFFVHPAEASHGDLGMITPDDAVFMLSNSGETQELKDIIYYCKRFHIPIIAVARKEKSALIEAADYKIVLPNVPEASPVNIPTTSTTMMLALGDALAVCLLEKRGFTKEDFHVFHPGGKLGANLIKVQELMHSDEKLPVVDSDHIMSEVIVIMTQKAFGCVGVVDKKRTLIGIITDGDLRRNMSASLLKKTAIEVMTKNPITLSKNILAAEALNIMNSKKITNLFIVEKKQPIGIIHIHDCLRAGIQ